MEFNSGFKGLITFSHYNINWS